MSGRLLPVDLVARAKVRAADPTRRSDRASLAAHSVPIEAMLASLPPIPDAALQARVNQVFGMLSSLFGMFGGRAPVVATLVGDGGGELMSIGGEAAVPPLTERCDLQRIATAEAKLGFELPPALRQLYVEIADGGFGPGEGLYGLDAMIAKWREVTCELRVGQDWPQRLLPIAGLHYDLICLDRHDGRIVRMEADWDVAEGSEDADVPEYVWDFEFTSEADSLEAWLIHWLDRPTRAELVRELSSGAGHWQSGFVHAERQARIRQWFRDHPDVEPPPAYKP